MLLFTDIFGHFCYHAQGLLQQEYNEDTRVHIKDVCKEPL